MVENPKVATASVAPEALAVPALARVGDTVLYARSLVPIPGQSVPLGADVRVAFVTKVHEARGGTVNLVYFQKEKGEDPVQFAEDVPYHVDTAWPGHWSRLPV
jgi:hypothetical protein